MARDSTAEELLEGNSQALLDRVCRIESSPRFRTI